MTEAENLAALDRAARESTEEQQLLWMRPATHRISTELLALYRAGRIAVIDDEAVPVARATAAEAWLEVLKERLEQAAHNLEVGAQLYECPGLEEAGKLARQVLKGSNNG
jgi:hypothetical protein